MAPSVLVTGANRGLGFALVKDALQRDYEVYACLHLAASDRIKELKKQAGDRLRLIEDVDVGDDGSVVRAAAALARFTDRLDILINNTGILIAENFYSKLEDFNFQIAMDTFNVNSLGPLRMAKALAGFVARSDKKVIVNITSEAGSASGNFRDFGYDYCMSKAALNMQSVILQKYLLPRGIKVLAIQPGWMRTDMGTDKAALDPAQSAAGILDLAERYSGQLEAGIYMDYQGTRMDW